MPVTKIDLSQEIKKWIEAVKGREVRAANTSAFEKIQTVVNDTVDDVNQASEDVKTAASDVADAAKAAADTVKRSGETLDHADEVLKGATQQASNSAGSAKLAESWSGGGTGIREDEDSNNSRYFSRQAESEAGRAKQEADRAAVIAEVTYPSFEMIYANGHLIVDQGKNVTVRLDDNKHTIVEVMT